MSSRIELSGDPPIHGREPGGHSSTAAIHQPAETTAAAADPTSCASLLPAPAGPAIR
ncbi:Uncharacterised protein [Mycobacteroides abscessus subsp. abscessus]|nr:Uncharacterised protein [Mycobacteroides abscessus subsp. abscessus]